MNPSVARRLGWWIIGSASLALVALSARPAQADEAAVCRSDNPAEWPQPARPYFMIAFDTSGSMNDPVGSLPSCAGYPDTRSGHARCALRNMVNAFAGEVNFGLASFPGELSLTGTPAAACPGDLRSISGCSLNAIYAGDGDTTINLCGNRLDSPEQMGTAAAAGNILVPLTVDNYWEGGTNPSNYDQILSWVDNSCGDCKELYTLGGTPLNGLLRDVERYFETQWVHPLGTGTYASPLFSDAIERSCRSVNVILLTDGAESCDPGPPGTDDTNAAQAALAAADLLSGFTKGANTFKAYTHVISFAGVPGNGPDNIAAAGCDDPSGVRCKEVAYDASNEATLSSALAAIIQGSIEAEVCDNADNNCNGCTDEGWRVWCNRGTGKSAKTIAELDALTNPGSAYCCSGTHDACMAAYAASIATNPPKGSLGYLPCWDPSTSSTDPEDKWVCVDPGEVCDDADNNCESSFVTLTSNTKDEGFNKCPSCPTSESCDGTDNDCDGFIDNAVSGSGSPRLDGCTQCIKKTEVCNGCDDDCDGEIDENIASTACGLTSPSHCKGTRTCVPSSGPPGSCTGDGAQFTACSNSVSAETCNGVDDDCDGIIDNLAPGNPEGVGDACGSDVGECVAGTKQCINAEVICVDSVGPSDEICDELDNDCDGLFDGNDPSLGGVGLPCGTDVGGCDKGQTVCVAGEVVCNQPNGPEPEQCNGVDDDCNGSIDDGTLSDQPSDLDCWALEAGDPLCDESCVFPPGTCAPVGADCQAPGTITAPCSMGTAVCEAGWVCKGGSAPSGEVCDGVDNDCDGTPDDGTLPDPIGDTCGADLPGPCEVGTIICKDGAPFCEGGVLPEAEVCDGIDNDCNGTNNNGIPIGDECSVDYDTDEYPGSRSQGVCAKGNIVCADDGTEVCQGGVGPSPEVCDGLDNDCDGATDEIGPQPDGIDGTANPEDATQVLGASCGGGGTCKAGAYKCVNGAFACIGGISATPEICDCIDNDCDGEVDEDAAADEAALCSSGKTCVEVSGGFCQCAAPCQGGEFPCPGGFTCRSDVPRSGTDDLAGRVCVTAAPCSTEICASKTVMNNDGSVECAPAGSQPSSSRPIPVCECMGTSGCHSPCFGKNCPSGDRCVPQEPFTGECWPDDNCFLFGCQAGQLCTTDGCVTNPCADNPCAADEVCKPSANNAEAECVPSCAEVDCPSGETCSAGECVATGCGEDCPEGQFCVGESDAKACGDSLCARVGPTAAYCEDGSYCDPETAQCGNDPCAGIVCPVGQICGFGECVLPVAVEPTPGGEGGEGGEGNGGPGDGGETSSTGGFAGTAGNGPADTKGIFGLATGGGGCGCRTAGGNNNAAGILVGLLLVGSVMERRRRRRTRGAAVVQGGAL